MKKQQLFLIFFLSIFFNNLKAQDFNFNPDPHSLGLGMGGVVNVNSGPGDYYYNPALLGYFSRETNLSYQTFSANPFRNFANPNCITIGYKYSNVLKGLDISAGFGYKHMSENGYYWYSQKNDAYSFGLSIDYFINLSFGMTFKNGLSVYNTEQEFSFENKSSARDFGLLLNVPVLKLIDPDYIYKPGVVELKPFINFSLGYSRSNIADKKSGLDESPLPLTARLGYNISFGSDMKLPGGSIQLIDINLMIEASDVLEGYDYWGHYYHRSGIGNIKIGENLLKWKGTENSQVSKGKSITLLETVSLLRGSYHYSTEPGVPTEGYELSSGGVFKILSSYAFYDNRNVKYVLDHLELKYIKSFIDYGSWTNFKLSAFSVSVKNLSF